jgi:hypothetical protein
MVFLARAWLGKLPLRSLLLALEASGQAEEKTMMMGA